MGKGQVPAHAWKAGESGNPGGRPAAVRELRALARTHTREAMLALVAALQRPREAVAAATIILAYGHGRPVQNVVARVIRGVEDLTDAEIAALLGQSAEEIEGEAEEKTDG